VYLSIIIGVLVLLGLGVLGVSLLFLRLNRYLGYFVGVLSSLLGLSPIVSFVIYQAGWFSEDGGPEEVVGVALVMLFAGAILFGSFVFWGYVIYRANRNKI